ncbi:MAG: 2-amino-3,7-dideoxy-D-threo-hept-6-ulosonate synthase [Candidatus Bathyarchaeia archaeon]
MVSGKSVRLSRIMREGKMLCIPMDHGLSIGPVKGLDNIFKTIKAVDAGGATSILVNKGILKAIPFVPRAGLIAHLSASTSIGPSPNFKVISGSVEEALRLGADAVSVHINIGAREESEMLESAGAIGDACDEWGVPFITMMYPRGEQIKDPNDPEVVAHVARVGAELGADIVKTVYTGDVDSFKKVVSKVPVPVVIAGGPKLEDDLAVLKMVKAAMESGAAGVTIGRNIFQHEDPELITRAIAKVVFDNASLEEALGILNETR